MKRAELLSVSGNGLCDVSRTRLNYLTAVVGDGKCRETEEAWKDGVAGRRAARLNDRRVDPVRLSPAPPVAPCPHPLDVL